MSFLAEGCDLIFMDVADDVLPLYALPFGFGS
jgi:hypothetical protein